MLLDLSRFSFPGRRANITTMMNWVSSLFGGGGSSDPTVLVRDPGITARDAGERPNHEDTSPVANEQTSRFIMAAGEGNNFGAARDMLESGYVKRVDIRNEKGFTALMMAGMHGNWETFVYLVEHGADIHARDYFGTSVLMHACNLQRTDVRIVRYLLARRVDVNVRSNNRMTALMLAAESGKADIVRELIAYGADVEARDDKHRSPLWWAATWGHLPVCLILADAGRF